MRAVYVSLYSVNWMQSINCLKVVSKDRNLLYMFRVSNIIGISLLTSEPAGR